MYNYENWRRIARYLNSPNYKNVHVLNHAQIIDDAFYFTITGQAQCLYILGPYKLLITGDRIYGMVSYVQSY